MENELIYLNAFTEYLKEKDFVLFDKVSLLGVIRDSQTQELELFSEAAFGEFFSQDDWNKVIEYQERFSDPSRS